MFFKKLLPVGTRSLLFGVHQFLWHPIVVYIAWWKLYGPPTIKQAICIIVHDWGYWGKENMNGQEGITHPELGAKIAGFLFGEEYRDLVLYHSRTYAEKDGVEPSLLCWPDKLSLGIDPKDFYLFRARISGEIKEYKKEVLENYYLDLSDHEWYDWLECQLTELAYLKAGDP